MTYQQGSGYKIDTYAPTSDPLTYCAVSQLDSDFNHPSLGKRNGPNSSSCQHFMGQRCAKNWDNICEYKSRQTELVKQPVMTLPQVGNPYLDIRPGINNRLSEGELLLVNTADEKYLVAMSANCKKQYELFDQTNPSSPMISTWTGEEYSCGSGFCYGGKCIPLFDVDEMTIDNDPVMNKLLEKPWLWLNGFVNIYRQRMKTGKLKNLMHTKLFKVVFSSMWFQGILRNKM